MVSEKVNYTEQGIRKAVHSYWWYSTGSPYLFLLIPYTALLIYRVLNDDINWFVWVVGLVVLFYTVIMIYIYVAYIKNSLGWFRSMKKLEVTLELREEQLCITVDDETRDIVWNSITQVREAGNYWILMLSPSKYDFMILPAIELTQEAKLFIISKVETVLYQTDQLWKIRAQIAIGHISIFLVFVPWLTESFPPQWTTPSYAIGGTIAVIGIAFSYSIRCPKCRTNWNSRAAKEISKGSWPDFLLALRKCPFCGVTGSDLNGSRIAKTFTN